MEIVKVFKSTENALPEGGSAFAAAKDIRADISKIDDKFLFNCSKVWVKEHAQTGDSNTAYYINRNEEDGFIRPAILIMVNGRVLIPSGIKIQLPEGFSMDVRPRSGLSLKYGLMISNSPGLIDEDYRGDIGTILTNQGVKNIIVVDGERIAQLKIVKDIEWKWEQVNTEDELSNTERGTGGFGSTGTK